MSKYKDGKIYKVVCDETNLVYYGSTIQPLYKRFWQHKQKGAKNGCMTMKMTNPKIFLVEKFPCNDREELLMRERYYMEKNECCNKFKSIRTKEEKQVQMNKCRYNYNNSENGKKKKKEWAENNKEKLREKQNERRLINGRQAEYEKRKEKRRQEIPTICVCGSSYKKHHKARHEKSNKHINFINSN